MKYSLIYYPHDTLRKVAEEVKNFDKNFEELLLDMRSNMDEKRGVGIAAPQVDSSLRCFLVRIDEDQVLTFVNPVISNFSEEIAVYEEGCLSIPGVYADIERPAALHVKAQDEKGKFFEMETDGFLARVIQHELDHLDGVLFFDHMSRGGQRRLLKAYTKLREAGLEEEIEESREEE